MKVMVKGVGSVTLNQDQHYVATGGQASVYVRDDVAYKIYTDPKDMIPTDKFADLQAIQDPNVIKPEALILSPSNKPIGYTMRAVKDAHSLCSLFTKGFRDRLKVTNDHIVTVASKLREHTLNVHRASVLIVDFNEFNGFASALFDDVYLIDVDSYQTRGYPATVILPSVRDYSVPANKFSELSDWFSYAVLTFQLFIGVHPYKGTHAGSAQLPKDQKLEHRMRNHISAFRSDVSIPGCCYPFDSIPQDFRQWLKAVLDEGKRLPPPDPRHLAPIAILQSTIAVVSTNSLKITKLFEIEGDLLSYADDGNNCLTLSKGKYGYVAAIDGHRIAAFPTMATNAVVGFTPKLSKPVGLYVENGTLHLVDFSTKKVSTVGPAEAIVKSGQSFHIKNWGGIYEVSFIEMSTVTASASHCVARVLEKASTLYEGVSIQKVLGSTFVSLFPNPKEGYQIRIPELDKYRVVDAKFMGGVLMVYAAKGGVYDRLVFKFNETYSAYDVIVVEDIMPTAINFVSLDSKVCVSITEEEKIEAFLGKKGSTGAKISALPKPLHGGTKLLKVKGKVAFEHDSTLYRIEMT